MITNYDVQTPLHPGPDVRHLSLIVAIDQAGSVTRAAEPVGGRGLRAAHLLDDGLVAILARGFQEHGPGPDATLSPASGQNTKGP